jgi:hopanoid biosynthesis associated RND transporter like protein HpnN
MTQADSTSDGSTPQRLVPRLLVGLVSVVCRFPVLVLTLAALSVAASVWAACTRLQYRTQRDELISPDKECQQRWRQYINEFGDDEDMVVVVRGSGPAARARMTAALEALADKVRRQPALFDRLFYKVDLRHLSNRALLFLPPEKIGQIQQDLERMKPLLGVGPLAWRMFSLQSLLDEAARRLSRLKPGQPLPAGDEQFLTQLLAITRSARATLLDAKDYRNPWSSLGGDKPAQPAPRADSTEAAPTEELLTRPQYFFSGDGALAFLLVRPLKEAGSFTAAKKSVDTMRAIVADVRPSFPEVEFGLTGLPVLETNEMEAAEYDTRLASWLAIAGVSLLFIVVYRGLRYPLVTIATLLVGTSWALGWLTLTVGHLNILSATFAVMLIGMGDYGVLWVMRYEQARRLGYDVPEALRHTAAHVAVGNLTAATTLALAFFAAMFADFQAVAELGWIAGCGVLFCAFACFTILPALLMVLDRRPQESKSPGTSTLRLFDSSAHGLPEPATPWLPRLSGRRWVIGVGAAVTAVLALCAGRVTYDHNLLHLQPRNLEAVRWEMTLIEHTAGASWHALSSVPTKRQALELRARFEQEPGVSRVVEVASLVPADQESKLPQLCDIRARLSKLPPRGQPIVPLLPAAAAPVQRGIEKLVGPDLQSATREAQLLRLLDVADAPPALLATLEEELSGLRDRLARLPAAEASARLQGFERRVVADLAEDLHRLREVATPVPIRLEDLPQNLRERYVGKNGQWLLRVFARDCLWDFEPLEQFTRRIQEIDPTATGKPFSTVEGLKAMKNGLQRAGVYALLVIVVVLALDFRSPRHVLIAVTPLAMGVAGAMGIMGLAGFQLNPANMMAFPLLLGVGVDNGVHVLHDYLLRRAAGWSTISYAIGRGVLVKALTTMIGFGTLMVSSERGLVGLGFILTLGVGCCMLTSLVFLPAVLNQWSRRTQQEPAEAPAVIELRRAA